MARCGFRRGDRNVISVLSQNLFQGLRLPGIVQMRGGSVRIHVVNFLRRNARIVQSQLHAGCTARAFRSGSRDVVSIAVRAVSDDFRENLCPPLKRMLLLFQNQNPGAFAHDEAASLRVKRNARAVRILSLAQCLHGREAADSKGRDRRLRSAADHQILIAVADPVERVADRIVAARAGRHRAGAHSAEAVINGNPGGGHIGDRHRNEERTDLLIPLLHAAQMLLLDDGEAADSAGDDHARVPASRLNGLFVLFLRRNPVNSRHLQCLCRCIKGKLRKPCHPESFSFVQTFRRVEVLHLRRKLYFKIRCIKLCNRSDAVFPFANFRPALFHAVPERVHGSEAGYHNLSFH